MSAASERGKHEAHGCS